MVLLKSAFRIFAFMADIAKEIETAFGNRLRLRVSGICVQNDSVLLIKHKSLGKKGILWAPPGGGLKFGETIHEALKREFLEETGLIVEIGELISVNEYLEPPLHAVELFFKVIITDGNLSMGLDPELSTENQIISEIKFIPFSELAILDPETVHSLFQTYKSPSDFLKPALFLQNIIK